VAWCRSRRRAAGVGVGPRRGEDRLSLDGPSSAVLLGIQINSVERLKRKIG
jgi:hypothetical protein